MNTPLEKLHTEAQNIRMSQAEKSAMYARLQQAMGSSVHPTRPVQSTYFMYSWRMVGSFAVLAVVVLGSGTTYAAQGALPGSPLYPIKVGVNEPIKEVLAFSNEAKIKFHTETAQVRLEEAEALASEGRLDNEVSVVLAANITKHVERVQTIAKEIEEVDPAVALEATVQLDSSIAAHGEVLAHLGDRSEDESTRENSLTLAYGGISRNMGGGGDASGITMAMRATAPAVSEVTTFSATTVADPVVVSAELTTVATTTVPAAKTTATNRSISSTTSPEEKAINQLQRKVEGRLQAVRSQFNAFNKSLSATTSASVEARINFFEDRIDAAQQAAKEQNFELARAEYNSVFAGIIELSTFLTADRKFNKGILDSLLKKYNFEAGSVKGVMDSEIEIEMPKVEREKTEIKKEDGKDDTKRELEVGGIRVDVGF